MIRFFGILAPDRNRALLGCSGATGTVRGPVTRGGGLAAMELTVTEISRSAPVGTVVTYSFIDEDTLESPKTMAALLPTGRTRDIVNRPDARKGDVRRRTRGGRFCSGQPRWASRRRSNIQIHRAGYQLPDYL